MFDLETFYPAKERLQLAMALNNLIAAPGFAAWMQGEALDVQRLLFTDAGKPRIAIISIAHLSDAERMFVVTLLLGEVVAWMRRQSGTSSLRALLYMDEIFGYFPPTAMPPSKLPLLTLMKQARAFGLGRRARDAESRRSRLQGTVERRHLVHRPPADRARQGARHRRTAERAGEGLDKAQLESLLANLGNRVFLMRNVHDDAPVLFRTRWALSYLRGPLTLQEIAKLSAIRKSEATAGDAPAARAPIAAAGPTTSAKPVIPAGVDEYYVRTSSAAPKYQPRVLAVARLHFVDKARGDRRVGNAILVRAARRQRRKARLVRCGHCRRSEGSAVGTARSRCHVRRGTGSAAAHAELQRVAQRSRVSYL